MRAAAVSLTSVPAGTASAVKARLTAWRGVRATGAVALAVGLLGVLAPSPARAAQCANAGAGIDDARARQLAGAARCLINEDRAQRDLRRLGSDSRLRKTAARHNEVMMREGCWSHECPGEPDLEGRIRRSGYLDGASRWIYAENFGCAQTPRGMVSAWLNSAFHRENIRRAGFRDIGVAAVRDHPRGSPCSAATITFTVVFARRWG
ncbi:MAG: CAP domain-containing protein [Solirubrobacterales bacterium]